jgi:hypothetical protein
MLKKIKIFALLFLIFTAGFSIGNASKYYLDKWKSKRNIALWMDGLEAPFRNDKYGGKTPEETFDMYLAALKKGDLELASKYFAIERQKQELANLNNKKDQQIINIFIDKLSNARNIWQKKQDDFYNWSSRAAFQYKTTVSKMEYIDFQDPKTGKMEKIPVPPGEYNELIQFEKNYNIWKLYLL